MGRTEAELRSYGSMPTYLLCWNARDTPWPDRKGQEWYVSETRAGRTPILRWSTGNLKKIKTDDRVFLICQRVDRRGIIGSGYASEDSYRGPHWDKSRRNEEQNKVDVRWDVVLDRSDVLPVDEFVQALGETWNTVQSARSVPGESAERLEALWRGHLTRIGTGQYYDAPLVAEPSSQDESDENDYAIEDCKAEIKQRQKQSVFRRRVLENFGGCCCISGVSEPDLLVASHVVPWSQRKDSRLDPANGLCLFALYDALFDGGYFTLSKDLQIVVARAASLSDELRSILNNISGKSIRPPLNVEIRKEYLEFHRRNIFKNDT